MERQQREQESPAARNAEGDAAGAEGGRIRGTQAPAGDGARHAPRAGTRGARSPAGSRTRRSASSSSACATPRATRSRRMEHARNGDQRRTGASGSQRQQDDAGDQDGNSEIDNADDVDPGLDAERRAKLSRSRRDALATSWRRSGTPAQARRRPCARVICRTAERSNSIRPRRRVGSA